VATMGPADVREVVFELIPRKVSVPASEARAIIDELRAFYAFLKRAFALPQADACLRVLGGRAVQQLERELSDPSNFGMAKSFFMQGQAAGFDMETQEGMDAWVERANRTPGGAPFRLPSFELPPAPKKSPKVDKAKKNKRKAARKARRRKK